MKKIYSGLFLFLAVALFLSFPAEAAKQTGRWKTIDGNKYYIKENGAYARKSYQINDTYYIFDLSGKLIRPKKNKLVTVGSNTFYVDTKGRAISGWQIIKNKLYYTTVKGRMRSDVVCQGITLSKSGAAVKNTASNLKMETMKIVSSITKDSMTKEQKLQQVWNYCSSRQNFYYAGKYPVMSMKSWQKITAYDMLTSRGGNCYSFACAFAALAAEIGYNPYVVCGRIPGSRDGARDGYTRHSWVQINGYHYDPEGKYAGMFNVYGANSYPISYIVQQKVNFKTN